MLEFARAHPGFVPRGTFYVNRLPFGSKANAKRALRWLTRNGFEIGNHTHDHIPLRGLADDQVRKQLATGAEAIREVLPNLVAPIVVYSTLLIPTNILFEAALSFLGLGVPQRTPSWGGMLFDATQYFRFAWWLMFFPGIFLILTTLSFNLLGDGLRDALDPRSNR